MKELFIVRTSFRKEMKSVLDEDDFMNSQVYGAENVTSVSMIIHLSSPRYSSLSQNFKMQSLKSIRLQQKSKAKRAKTRQ